ncbi:MAG TPA: ornithine cyclodeaminase family protein [Candidatus Xenobia bacterium]|jgi:ornithine cyclodeaminase/alanine dehydrogenase-like protein (mu-crystallin family)
MPLYLSEADVQALLTPADAVHLLEEAFRAQAEGGAVNLPRRRLVSKPAVLHVLPAALPPAMGLKAYVSTPKGISFVVLVFNSAEGTLDAIVEANRLGQVRTGAASALATKYLAPHGRRVGLVGTGYQAWGQVEALASVISDMEVKVYGRDVDRKDDFVKRVGQELWVTCRAVSDVAAACRDVDVLVTATSAREPFLRAEYLRPGLHVNAMGINRGNAAELTMEAVMRCSLKVVDDVEQAKTEAGDLMPLVASNHLHWNDLKTLRDLVTGKVIRASEDISLFKSLGIGLEDIAVAQHVYRKALETGRGTRVG